MLDKIDTTIIVVLIAVLIMLAWVIVREYNEEIQITLLKETLGVN